MSKDRIILFRALHSATETPVTSGNTRLPRIHEPLSILYLRDPSEEIYFVSLARDRITVSSYTDDAIRKMVEAWADSVPELK